MKVRISSTVHDKHGELIAVKRIFQHEKYSPSNIDYDYSLLELASPIEFDETAQPIGLPDLSDSLADGTYCLGRYFLSIF